MGGLKQHSRSVLWLIGRRMTSVYGSSQIQLCLFPDRPHTMNRKQLHAGLGVAERSLSMTIDKSHMSTTTTNFTAKTNDPPSNGGSTTTTTGRPTTETPPLPPQPPPSLPVQTPNPTISVKDKKPTVPLIIKPPPFDLLTVRSKARNGNKDDSVSKEPVRAAPANKQQIGELIRHFSLEHEMKDSNGKTLYIPGDKKLRSFPLLRAGAWLQPDQYCRGGGQSIAGSDAARRLLRGKKNFILFLRYAVHRTKSHSTFVLQNHGVPPELLQNHIDLAARMLVDMNALELCFKQSNKAQQQNSLAAVTAVNNLSNVRARKLETGETVAYPWPYDGRNDFQTDLQLYWTVMNRIATRLGVAVLFKRPQQWSDEHDEVETSPNSVFSTPPQYWKVEFERMWHYSEDKLPLPSSNYSSDGKRRLPLVYPVVQWTPLQENLAPGHVKIRLQGISNHDVLWPMKVSLSFDAFFRTSNIMEV